MPNLTARLLGEDFEEALGEIDGFHPHTAAVLAAAIDAARAGSGK